MKEKPFIAVSSRLASTIRGMDAELKESFGCDYAYTIMGHGEILAASNLKDGRIEPVENGERAHQESGCTDYLQHSAESCPEMIKKDI